MTDQKELLTLVRAEGKALRVQGQQYRETEAEEKDLLWKHGGQVCSECNDQVGLDPISAI